MELCNTWSAIFSWTYYWLIIREKIHRNLTFYITKLNDIRSRFAHHVTDRQRRTFHVFSTSNRCSTECFFNCRTCHLLIDTDRRICWHRKRSRCCLQVINQRWHVQVAVYVNIAVTSVTSFGIPNMNMVLVVIKYWKVIFKQNYRTV